MYLRFEDWSVFKKRLGEKKLPNVGRVIKVFASEHDPRTTFNKLNLRVIEVDGDPFGDEIYQFEERDTYSGKDLEAYLSSKGLDESAKAQSRALFRFATREDTLFTQRAMNAKSEGSWLINHPLEDIDGLKDANNPSRENSVHLDIFFPPSIEAVRNIVDIDNPENIITFRERMNIERSKLKGKER